MLCSSTVPQRKCLKYFTRFLDYTLFSFQGQMYFVIGLGNILILLVNCNIHIIQVLIPQISEIWNNTYPHQSHNTQMVWWYWKKKKCWVICNCGLLTSMGYLVLFVVILNTVIFSNTVIFFIEGISSAILKPAHVFWWSDWWISTDLVNHLPFKYNTQLKQWYSPSRLPGIVYLFELKMCPILTQIKIQSCPSLAPRPSWVWGQD